jgi:hAT family C-terminal dimerisation region
MDSVLWWQSLFSSSYSELTALAKWALCIASTISAAERNWSAFGHIHSKKRNRLLNEQINKLVYLY